MSALRLPLLAVCLALGSLASAQAADLVANGDFESPVVSGSSCFLVATVGSWSSNANDGSCYIAAGAGSAFATPYSGQQMMYVNNKDDVGSTISQAVTLTAGQQYLLTFAMAGLNGESIAPVVSVDVANGTQIFTSAAGASWAHESLVFTSTVTGTSILGFSAANAAGLTLDAVSLAPVPEPASFALMLGGLALVGAGIARRRAR